MPACPSTATARAMCHEAIRLIDRAYTSSAPDEPDLGMNISCLTARRSLERLASAEDWELPPPVASAIRTKLHAIAAIRDPHVLEAEALTFPEWVLGVLERRKVRRTLVGPTPGRRAGERAALRTR